LFTALQPHTATDASACLKGTHQAPHLARLLAMDALVCARLVDGALPRITPAQLRTRCHLPASGDARHTRPATAADMDWRVWVATRGLVFDVTVAGLLMMMVGRAEMQGALRPWLGKEVRDEEAATLLRERYGSFVVGELAEEQRDIAAKNAQARGKQLPEMQDGRRGRKRRVGDLDGEDWEVRSKGKLLRSRR
ncbi:hypothetical protein BT67DRAFT_437465, partial [Trichocladium antarcticum]